jgi:hypothetical protein
VFCGSHDKSLYSINLFSGVLIWKVSFNSVIFSSPCYLPFSSSEDAILCICSTKGEICLIESSSGKILQSVDVKGEKSETLN